MIGPLTPQLARELIDDRLREVGARRASAIHRRQRALVQASLLVRGDEPETR
jgi:hypothetical protein